MNQVNMDLVRSIAESVRYWAEGRAVGTIGEEDLSGWCAIASAELWRQLTTIGFQPEIHAWVCPQDLESSHVYLVVDDHVVDITATQFSKMRAPIVYIAHVKEAERWDWYHLQEVFRTPKELIHWQKKSGWSPEQVAWSK